ncbi:MAG: hypothetical protein GXP18_03770 [Gammaproteobacteria bacterium]|nr:hypothetical protein [Gammaproteobacteria bacterium]
MDLTILFTWLNCEVGRRVCRFVVVGEANAHDGMQVFVIMHKTRYQWFHVADFQVGA